jgi:hypothetical protein
MVVDKEGSEVEDRMVGMGDDASCLSLVGGFWGAVGCVERETYEE